MRPTTTLLICGTLLAGGCYSYVPAALPELQPGAAVRVRISGAEADRLTPIRFTDSRNLEGSIVELSDRAVYIDAIIRTVDPHGITAQHVQRLDIAPQEILSVHYRRLDGLRTAAAAGSVAFVLAGAAWVVLYGDLGGIDQYEPGDFPLRTPLLRFRH
jgi:hypothetical protein